MKAWAAGLIVAMVVAAQAAPIENYIAQRDRAIAALKTDPSSKTASIREKRALAALETALAHQLKPLEAEGFSTKGKINLETLIEDQGYGRLDGLAYTASKLSTRVVVSSDALLAAWLKTQTDVPKDVATAIHTDGFYFQALGGDAAFATFASLPVAPKEAGLAAALLVQRRQDISAGPPDEIVGTMTRGDRVFVVSQHVATPVAPIPVCDTLRVAEQKKADAVLETYNKSGSTDEKLFERYTKLQDEGDVMSRRCFGDHFSEHPAYRAILRQAETLFDRLR